MSSHRVAHNPRLICVHCDGCGASDNTESPGAGRRKIAHGWPKGWIRMRAGADQADLCVSCQLIGIWRDNQDAAWNAAAAASYRALAGFSNWAADLIGADA